MRVFFACVGPQCYHNDCRITMIVDCRITMIDYHDYG